MVQTKSCEAPHLQYHVAGRLHVVMDDGSEAEFGPGEGLAEVHPSTARPS